MTPISWFFITKIIKPEPIADSCLQGIRDEAAGAKKIEAHEIKAIIVVVGLLVLWIAGNWIPVLNATVVALIGLTVMFLPGMELLTWKEFQNSVPWGIVIMCGTIIVHGWRHRSYRRCGLPGWRHRRPSGIMNLGFFAAFRAHARAHLPAAHRVPQRRRHPGRVPAHHDPAVRRLRRVALPSPPSRLPSWWPATTSCP